MRKFLRSNGLSLALFGLFLASIVGQVFAGWYALGEELAIHGRAAVLFALSFWLHLLGSTRRANEEALLHAARP